MEKIESKNKVCTEKENYERCVKNEANQYMFNQINGK